VYVGEEVVQPLADIALCQFEASHKGVDDSRVLGCIMIATEEIVLAPLCPGANYVGIIVEKSHSTESTHQ